MVVDGVSMRMAAECVTQYVLKVCEECSGECSNTPSHPPTSPPLPPSYSWSYSERA